MSRNKLIIFLIVLTILFTGAIVFLLSNRIQPNVTSNEDIFQISNEQELFQVLNKINEAIENRELNTFRTYVSNEFLQVMNDNYEQNKEAFSTSDINEYFKIFAPDILQNKLILDNLTAQEVLLQEDGTAVLVLNHTLTGERYAEASFIKEDNRWKYVGIFVRMAEDNIIELDINEVYQEILFTTENGFDPPDIEMTLGKTIIFKGLVGKVRTYQNPPLHFYSPELVYGDYAFKPENKGEYNYLLIYRNSRVLPFWQNDYKIFRGSLNIK